MDPIECEGCGVRYYFWPEEAIDFPVNTCGERYISDTRFGPMAHSKLDIAEDNSGKLGLLSGRSEKSLQKKRIWIYCSRMDLRVLDVR